MLVQCVAYLAPVAVEYDGGGVYFGGGSYRTSVFSTVSWAPATKFSTLLF